jgi:hypothetical protein
MILIIGIAIGAAAVWYHNSHPRQTSFEATQTHVANAATSARDAIEDKFKSWHLTGPEIKDELARTGKVIRDKSTLLGQKLSDATADTRITTAIKTKLVGDSGLSGLKISVNTTEGVVTLSGSVASADQIGKAMAIALEVDGVKQVISTIQVKS